MNVGAQSGYIAFRPRARLLKLIGSELISDDVLAVVELVKNAWDADATELILQFEDVTTGNGRLTITDNGHGMDRETLLGGWMEPAGSTKRGDGRRISPGGRWMLGEKGLGRFAADKLGTRLELVSRRAGSAGEVAAQFEWDRYAADDTLLGDVKNRWEIRPARDVEKHGTILRIAGIATAWNERMFRRLATRLARLRSPLHHHDGFAIRINSNEFPDYAGEIGNGFLDRAHYRIDARFDGRALVELHGGKGRKTSVAWTGSELVCGPVRVVLHAFDLEQDSLSRVGPRAEVRAWLKEWCGVSLYRDGFRVWPYGEPHDDWLRLDQKRVNNPVVCLSNNQVVGFVEITQALNPELKDQTNREGLVHTQAVDDLRRIIQFVVQLLEQERQGVRHPDHSRTAEAAPAAPAAAGEVGQLLALATEVGGRTGARLRGIGHRLEEEEQRRAGFARVLEGKYAELAARGQSIATLSAEALTLIEATREAAGVLRKTCGKVAGANAALLQLKQSTDALRDRLGLVAFVSHGARRSRVVDLTAELKQAETLFGNWCASHSVALEVERPRRNLIRADISPQSLHLVLQLLIDNAMDWVHQARRPAIRMRLAGTAERVNILVSDNGAGIPASAQGRIFEAGFSLKEGGRGMGLTLARHLVSAHAGSVFIEKTGGAGTTMCVSLPRKHPRATVG